jgi:anaerobic magnesium-protoporphyrin IX monomethyl ester cyclase
MKVYLLNPTLKDHTKFIREGRCMQKASSWATVWPPITLALLGTIAEKWGPVRLLDGDVEDVTMDELMRDLRTVGPDLVVVNTGFPSIDSDMAIAKRIKEAFPETRILAFGVYFTMLEKEAFQNHPFLDFCLVGEPELTFAELLESLHEKQPNLAGIRGLMYRDGTDLRVNPPRPLLEDLDQLPMPDRGLLRNDRYRLPHNNKVFTLINTSRGCPYSCTYCIVKTYYGKKPRRHSLERILEEVQNCREKFGIQDFLFWEEVFSLDKTFVRGFCHALIDRAWNIRWAATTRVTAVDAETLALMRRAGCYLIGLGIESGCQSILDAAKKNQTLDDTRRAVKLAKQAKIQTMGHFIFGLPGETKETAEQTIRFMLDLGLDYMQCYCAVPYPKTELGELARAQGWIRGEKWSDYDFGGNSILQTDTLRREDVDHFRRKAFRRFYFRPAYIARKLFRDLSIRQTLRMASFGDWMNLVGLGTRTDS